MTDSENYLTMNELIKHLKVTRTSINRWMNKGMPSVKLGTLRRFKISEVENWLRNSKK
jgi:excisionase family DNA binding protein